MFAFQIDDTNVMTIFPHLLNDEDNVNESPLIDHFIEQMKTLTNKHSNVLIMIDLNHMKIGNSKRTRGLISVAVTLSTKLNDLAPEISSIYIVSALNFPVRFILWPIIKHTVVSVEMSEILLKEDDVSMNNISFELGKCVCVCVCVCMCVLY